MAAIFNLNHPSHSVHWSFIDLSVANVIVMIVLVLVFAVAVLAPFPGHRNRSR